MLCLRVPTDAAWVSEAMRDVGAVLVDQAFCEVKAASNALSLAARFPVDAELVRKLTDLAREEIDHFQRVVAVLSARGLTLGRPPVDAYAKNLRTAARDLPHDEHTTPLVDRLLVGALIEARSCERFKLLTEASTGDATLGEVRSMWAELLSSEARHYRTFVDLAVRSEGSRARVWERLERLAGAEAEIVRHLAISCKQGRGTIHG